MKKIIASIFALSLLCTASFAKSFFSERFCELKLGTDFDISNNVFSCNDFLKKDLVIDLRKIADDCPKNGFEVRLDLDPAMELNLNIFDMKFGVATGLQFYEKLQIGKDLFDFIGYGNQIGQTLDINFKNSTEVYAFTQATVGFKLGKLNITAQPAVFVPIISMNGTGGYLKVLNDTDGRVNVNMNLEMDVYTSVPLKVYGSDLAFDTDTTIGILSGSYGFDFGGVAAYSITDSFDVGVECRIPVIPGHLKNKATVRGGFIYDMTLSDFENSEKTEKATKVENENAFYTINRPLKFGIFASKDLLGTLFNARAGGGFGMHRPFCEGAYIYPEYQIGLTLNLLRIIKVGVSTEYTDQLFKHQIGASFNVRVMQLDLGISSQSSNFKKSMEVSGVGAYIYATVGF